MSYQEFTIVIAAAVLDEPTVDALYEAGCDDATVVSREGDTFIHFDREAETVDLAIASALRDVTKGLIAAGCPSRIARVQPYDGPSSDADAPAYDLANAGIEAGRLVPAGGVA
jgi:hypothetical protein